MRKVLGTTLLAVAIAVTGIAPSAARPIPAWRDRQCRFASYNGRAGFQVHEVELTIECATDRWAVRGGTKGARCIADNESGDRPRDRNTSSGAAGVYQWIPSTFSKLLDHHPLLVRRWHLKRSVWNARTNVVFAIRIASEAGWWPAWTTAPQCGLA